MKIETYLNAFSRASHELDFDRNPKRYDKRNRQYRAFRARILRMDAERDARIVELEGHNYALNLYIEETEMDSEKSLVIGREQ